MTMDVGVGRGKDVNYIFVLLIYFLSILKAMTATL